jgi:hypothetical protein
MNYDNVNAKARARATKKYVSNSKQPNVIDLQPPNSLI